MPAVVSDTSVLHYLAVTRQFNCLPKLFGEVIIPTAVWKEVSHHSELPVCGLTIRARADGWLKVQPPQDDLAVDSLRGLLGAGESEAIILAREQPASLLLMDDLDGRNTALKMKLKVTGTMGILVSAKRLGHLAQLKPILDELVTLHRFRLGKIIYTEVLREVGESV